MQLRSRIFYFLAPGLAALTGFWTYSPMLNARLGLIDDHEFLRFLSIGGQNLLMIPEMLAETELAHYGETLRFRPAYYTLRALETVIHGTDGFQWYLWRLTLFSLFVFCVTLLIQKVLHLFLPGKDNLTRGIALAGGLIATAMPAWKDIVMRLGPSELYLMLGVLVFAFGTFFVLASADKSWLGMILLTVGLFLALGSKENALSFLWPLFFVIVLAVLRGMAWHWGVLVLGLNSTMAAFVSLGFMPAVLTSGKDVYGVERSLAGWLTAAAALPQTWLTLIATLLTIWMFLRRLSVNASQSIAWIGLMSTPLVITLTEAYFYQYSVFNGSLSPGRYGVLVEFLAISAILQLIAVWGYARQERGSTAKQMGVVAALALALYPSVQLFNLSETRTLALQNSDYLNYQFQAIEAVARSVDSEGIGQILYISDEPYDYERINASRQFFELLSTNEFEIFLWTDFSNAAIDQTTLPLAEQLQSWSTVGNTEWGISPIENLSQDVPTSCVHFGQEPVSSPCSQSQWIGG